MRDANSDRWSRNPISNPEQLIHDIDREESEESLRGYVESAWPVLEPGREFIPGWHIDAVCEHLEAVSRGDIKRLLINVPPGTMKSLSVDVFWPTWEWGPQDNAHLRFVSWSYAGDLTKKHNGKARTLIQSPWYRSLWGDKFSLKPDQNQKTRFETNKQGYKVASSVGGVGTGERGDHLIIDDPHNVKQGESDQVRQETVTWFRETLTTRTSDPMATTFVVVMQRVHGGDVSGMLLSDDFGFDHLMLPMEFEPKRKCFVQSTGFEDPRTEEGELLWSGFMPRVAVERDKKLLGAYATAGQYQQRPSPRGGGQFKRHWFEVVEAAPAEGRICRGWDLAATTEEESKDAAWTCGVRLKLSYSGILYIEDVVRLRATPAKVDAAIKNTSSQDGLRVCQSLPQDPGQAGKAQKTHFARELHGYDIHFSTESGDKVTRAKGIRAQAEAENVKVVKGPWNGAFFDEIEEFPAGKFKDQVDGLSRAYARLISLDHFDESIPIAPTFFEE